MNTQHTPGPWYVANGVQIRSDKHQVAKAWSFAGKTGEANAQLIAAAPDLLAALHGVVRVADRATDEFDAARAAIFKATGEKV